MPSLVRAGRIGLILCGLGHPYGARAAGQQAVPNREYALPAARRWVVDPRPFIVVGSSTREAGPDLYGAVRAVRAPGGGVLIANAGHEILVIDSAGRHVTTLGRQGGGPGEFLALEWIRVISGDSILAWDGRQRRVSVFSLSGGFVKSAMVRLEGQHVLRVPGAWPDGLLLGTLRTRTTLPSDQLFRDTLTYVTFRTDGEIVDTVGRFPDQEYYQVVVRSGNQMSTAGVAPPFRRVPRMALGTTGFWFGLGETFLLEQYSRTGQQRPAVNWSRSNRPVNDEMLARMRRDMAESAANELVRRAQERMLERVEVPRTLPAYGQILGDEVGNLWVREYPVRGDSSNSWFVFAPDGRLLGPVALPQGLEPTQIGHDYVLGVLLDNDDVPLVQGYRLIKP